MTQADVFARTKLADKWAIVGLLSLAMALYLFQWSIMVEPWGNRQSVKEVPLASAAIGGLLNAALWARVVALILAGRMVDRWGVKYPSGVGLLVAGLTFAAAGLAGSSWPDSLWVIVWILWAAAFSIVLPGSMRWLQLHCAERERGLALGLCLAGFAASPGVGYPVVALLGQGFNWRKLCLAVGALSVTWLVSWMSLVKNDDRQLEQALAPRYGHDRFSWQANPVPAILMGYVLAECLWLAFDNLPLYLQEEPDLHLEEDRLYKAFRLGGWSLVGLLAGWLADRFIARGADAWRVRKRFVVTGFVLACVGALGAVLNNIQPLPHTTLAFALLAGIGVGLALVNYWGLTLTLIPPSVIGRFAGVQQCLGVLANLLTPPLISSSPSSTRGYVVVVTLVTLVAVIPAWASATRRP
jgi:MFS family permease